MSPAAIMRRSCRRPGVLSRVAREELGSHPAGQQWGVVEQRFFNWQIFTDACCSEDSPPRPHNDALSAPSEGNVSFPAIKSLFFFFFFSG